MSSKLSKFMASLEDSAPVLTENAELAQELVKEVTEQNAENEEIMAKKEAIIADATEQANDPFNPDAVGSAPEVETPDTDDSVDETLNPETGIAEDDTPDTEPSTDEEDSSTLDSDTSENDVTEESAEDGLDGDNSEELDLDEEPETEESPEGQDDEQTESNETGEADVDADSAEELPETEGEEDGTAEDGSSDDDEQAESSDDTSDESADASDDEQADSEDGDEADLEAGELEVNDVDLETTEEDVEEAEETADEEEAEAEDLDEEIVDDSKTLDELEGEKESLESYIGLMRIAMENNSQDPVFMAAVNLKLTKLKEIFGDKSPRTPSLEDYNASEAGDYYAFALESAEGFLGKIKKLVNTIAVYRGDVRRKSMIKRAKPRADALNKKADLLIGKLVDFDGKSDFVLKPKDLNISGNDLLQAISVDLKNLTLLGGKRLGDISSIYSEIISIFAAIESGGGIGKTEKLTERVLKLKPVVVTEFSKVGSFLSANYFTTEKAETSGSTLHARVNAHVKSLIPEIERGKVDNKTTEFNLKKNDIIRIVTICKAYLALSIKVLNDNGYKVEELQNKLDKDLNKILDKDFYRIMKEAGTELEKHLHEIEAPHGIVNGLKTANKNYGKLYRFTVMHGIGVTNSLLNAVEKGLSSAK